MYEASSMQVLKDVYSRAGSVLTSKGRYTTVNELTDQLPAVRPGVLYAALDVLLHIWAVPSYATVVLSEEDKGAILAGMFAAAADLPLAMARHNVTYRIPGAIQVPLSMEYMDGRLEIHGVKPGDQVVLIDDTLASGGTMVALINAIREAGATVVDIRVVVEKLGYGGREKVATVTDLYIHAGLGIAVDDAGHVTVP